MLKKEYMADFSLVLVALAWGLTFIPVQEAVEKQSVFIFLFWRFFIATIFMALISYKHLKDLNSQCIKAGVILGIFLFFAYVAQTFALKFTYSSSVAFITGLNVVFVPFLMFLIFKKRANIYAVFGALVATIGLALLSLNESLDFGFGEFLSLICAFCFALQIVYTGVFVKKYSVHLLVVMQFFIFSSLCLICAFAAEGSIIPKEIDFQFVKAIILTVLFATIFAYFVQTYMQQFTTSIKTAVIFTLEPMSAGVAGYFWANELLTQMQLFGAGLIIFGVLVSEVGSSFSRKIFKKYIYKKGD